MIRSYVSPISHFERMRRVPKLGITYHTEVTPNRVSISCDLDQEIGLNEKQEAQFKKKLEAAAKALIKEFAAKAKTNKVPAAA